MEKYTKYKRILLSVFLINALLVSTHKGEFWPFSIFPMFSQAGHPWSRGLVQEIEQPTPANIWERSSLEEVRPLVVSLEEHGVDPIDYANFVSKTTDWNEKRLHALTDLLRVRQNIPEQKYWLITKVEGHLTEKDSVVVQTTPLFLISADTLIRNPEIFGTQSE